MNLDALKNPIVSIALSVITALIVAISAATGFGAFGSSTPTPPAEESGALVVALPANAKTATPKRVEKILNGQWKTASHPLGRTLSFSRGDGATENGLYLVRGGACNGFGVALIVDQGKATYTYEDRPVTKMGCDMERHLYDGAVRGALIDGNTFYFDGTNAYLGKNGTGLKLSPAR
ncbi:hypothetical protein QP994_00145 [Corynebacterium sp. MSK044]|uniref:hypothetical protein n=1 Tax=Corynebacterium sp. MSK044 TaxID=3050195 RepID=UPI00254C0A4A|nr:hypothetical protein [Corynebacterium sp. MSK044]MDK8796297.1 hypothetical protein [Corynebacterium sp. MSK044]